jgi:hypothetical protein
LGTGWDEEAVTDLPNVETRRRGFRGRVILEASAARNILPKSLVSGQEPLKIQAQIDVGAVFVAEIGDR